MYTCKYWKLIEKPELGKEKYYFKKCLHLKITRLVSSTSEICENQDICKYYPSTNELTAEEINMIS